MTSVATLIEALPYIREFRGKTFVIRCPTRLSEEDRSALSRDVAMLRFVGVKAVVVHAAEEPAAGGSHAAGEGNTNHRLVHAIGDYGKATGLAGSDGAPRWLLSIADDGELLVDPDLVLHVIDDYTPVVEAVAVGPQGAAVPADPDLAAARLAVALDAYKVLFVVGDHRVVVDETDEQGEVSEMRATPEVVSLVKIDAELGAAFDAALDAVQSQRVRFAHLIPNDMAHALLLELFTQRGYGTKIRSSEDWARAEGEQGFPSRGYWCWSTDPRDDVRASGPE
jgi:acetylglutamate kinase